MLPISRAPTTIAEPIKRDLYRISCPSVSPGPETCNSKIQPYLCTGFQCVLEIHEVGERHPVGSAETGPCGYDTNMQAPNDKVKEFPVTPGVYLMKDAQGRVLYVGKAKHLRNRAGHY